METFKNEDLLYKITVEDLQFEAMEKMGRELTDEEIFIARKGFEWGIGESIGIVYNTIFTEMIEQ
ncbi:MAG: hypothetical protein ACR2FN_08945 [Chitinophagaceae bacterium]